MTATSIHQILSGPGLLRAALKLDAVVTGANGLAYVALAAPLEDLLGYESSLLRWAGVFLAIFAAGVWTVASRARIPRAGVLAVVAANAAWAGGSVVAAIAGWGSPATAGVLWTVLQAVVVAGFAELQLTGLARARR